MKHKMQRGVTLIELVFALAVVAVLTATTMAFLLPNYLNFKRTTALSDGELEFSTLQVAIRQQANDSNTYANICSGSEVVVQSATPQSSWTYQCAGMPSDSAYEVTAVGDCPAGTTASALSYQDNLQYPACGFTLDYTLLGPAKGAVEKTLSVPPGWTLPKQACWAKDKEGDCAG